MEFNMTEEEDSNEEKELVLELPISQEKSKSFISHFMTNLVDAEDNPKLQTPWQNYTKTNYHCKTMARRVAINPSKKKSIPVDDNLNFHFDEQEVLKLYEKSRRAITLLRTDKWDEDAAYFKSLGKLQSNFKKDKIQVLKKEMENSAGSESSEGATNCTMSWLAVRKSSIVSNSGE